MRALTKEQQNAIITTINIAHKVCDTMNKMDNDCYGCPFWSYCQHNDESMGDYLDNVFKNLLANN
jgi:hypothetical protein